MNQPKPIEFHIIPVPVDEEVLNILHGIEKRFMNRLQMSIGVPLDIFSGMSTLDIINALQKVAQEKDNE